MSYYKKKNHFFSFDKEKITLRNKINVTSNENYVNQKSYTYMLSFISFDYTSTPILNNNHIESSFEIKQKINFLSTSVIRHRHVRFSYIDTFPTPTLNYGKASRLSAILKGKCFPPSFKRGSCNSQFNICVKIIYKKYKKINFNTHVKL